MITPRILLMPLGNVLGHLTRTFSLAEKLFDKKMDVHITTGMHYPELAKALPEGITIHQATEMPVSSTRSLGPIRSYGTGTRHDRINTEGDSYDKKMLETGSRHLKKMIANDSELISRLQPDVIITDHRFTVTHLSGIPGSMVFHISNILGFPSLYHRAQGALYTPLNKGNILVPGIRSIEQPAEDAYPGTCNISWCGPFSWDGWNRMHTDANSIPEADLLLCFGSTGNASVMVPPLVSHISKNYRILLLAADEAQTEKRENLISIRFASLEHCIKKSKVVCCHGGHGTVMECILHRKPMLIIPNNLEQLEIGRRIEQLGLGKVINVSPGEMETHALNKHLEQLMTDKDIQKKLAHYAGLLKQHNGPEQAASVIMNALSAQ